MILDNLSCLCKAEKELERISEKKKEPFIPGGWHKTKEWTLFVKTKNLRHKTVKNVP